MSDGLVPAEQRSDSRTVLVDRPGPFDTYQDDYAAEILTPNGPQAVRVVLPPLREGDKPSRVYLFARPDDVATILKNDDVFDLSPYDLALTKVAGDVLFVLGGKSGSQDERRAIIQEALGAPGDQKHMEAGDEIRAIAREAARAFVARAKCRPVERRTFDVIREFGYFVPYAVTARFLGVSGSPRPAWLTRIFIWIRNLTTGRPLPLRGEQARCQNIVVSSHLVFGQVFGNLENRNGLLVFLATWAARNLNRRVETLIDEGLPSFEGTLLAKILRARSMSPLSDETYRAHTRAILFELAGAMTLLVGSSFGRIMSSLVDGSAPHSDFIAGLRGKNGDRFINEALRLDSTTKRVFRRVAATTSVGAVVLEPGDHICVLIDAAGRSCGRFRSHPPDNSAYINFGQQDGCHPCFGQTWARAILQEMFLALEDFEDLRPTMGPTARVKICLGLPDFLELSFERKARDHGDGGGDGDASKV